MLVLGVRNKQVIEFAGKTLHLAWYFVVINTVVLFFFFFFYTSVCALGGGSITCFLKLRLLFNFELRIYVVCISKSLVMSDSP